MDAGSGARIWHSASAVHMGPVACVQAVRCVDLLTVAAEEYFTRKHLWIRVVSRTSLVTAFAGCLSCRLIASDPSDRMGISTRPHTLGTCGSSCCCDVVRSDSSDRKADAQAVPLTHTARTVAA